MVAEIFPFFLFDLLFLGADAARSRKRKEEVRRQLQAAADRLGGRVEKPWFRAPRVYGHHAGRDVELIWRGSGRVELRCRAPADIALDGRRAGFLARLFGRDEAQVTGPQHLVERLRPLFRRFDLRRIVIARGQLTLRAKTSLDGARLAELGAAAVDLVWTSRPAPEVRVSASPTPAAAPPPKPAPGGLRCPFCHDALASDAPVVHCASCDAPHHPSCFEEGDGCSIAGCRERRAQGRRARA